MMMMMVMMMRMMMMIMTMTDTLPVQIQGVRPITPSAVLEGIAGLLDDKGNTHTLSKNQGVYIHQPHTSINTGDEMGTGLLREVYD